MLDFLTPARRKTIYQVFAVLNAVVVALVPVAQQFGFINDTIAQNIAQGAAGILSMVGFLLAAKNTDKPVEVVPQTGLAIKPGQEGPIVSE